MANDIGDEEDYPRKGLIKYKKYVCKENPQLRERQKTIARYWNTAQRERVQFVDQGLKITEDQTAFSEERMTLGIDNTHKQDSSKDNCQPNSYEVKHPRYLTEVHSNNKLKSHVDPPLQTNSCFIVDMDSNISKLDITPLNNSLTTHTNNKPSDRLQNKKTNKTIHSEGLKSCAGTIILGVFMIGLLLALVATMSSVQSGSRDQKVKTKLETEVDEEPVTLLSTKF